jgi:hypothetical protein
LTPPALDVGRKILGRNPIRFADPHDSEPAVGNLAAQGALGDLQAFGGLG